MKNILSSITLGFFTLVPQANSAVHLSSTETGSAIIVPFYTVSNQMNTLLSLNNTTDNNKAVKIHFKEAKSGDILTSFNVYLTGQDMWTMGMGQVPSTDGGRLRMISNDQSCTVGFPNSEDIAIEEDWLWENGTIEIIEMGTVADMDLFQPSGSDCEALADFWHEDQMWANNSEDQMSSATGGLHAEVTLMDVEQGHSANIPVIHMDGFYGEDNIQHTQAGDATPNLSTGTKDSLVMDDNQAIKTTWPTGYEAVSALITHTTVSSEFNVEKSVAAQTEWIISLPTLAYHLNPENGSKPFNILTDGTVRFPTRSYSNDFNFYDREAFLSYAFEGDPPPPPSAIAHTVLNFNLFDSNNTDISPMLTSNGDNTHHIFVGEFPPGINSPNGKGILYFHIDGYNNPYSQHNDRGVDFSNPAINHTYYGLPIIGFAYTKFTNANAQPGLLAQYAFIREHFGERKVVIGDSQ